MHYTQYQATYITTVLAPRLSISFKTLYPFLTDSDVINMSRPPSPSTTEVPAALVPLLSFLSSIFLNLSDLFHGLPGSPIIVRYIKSSYQNDPYRSLLEVLLIAFAVRTLLKGRTRGEGEGKNWVKLTEKEINELVDDFTPQSLVDIPSDVDEMVLPTVPMIHGPNGVRVKLSPNGKMVLNMAYPDWVGFAENEKMKMVAIETLRSYGVGSCGPSGFYGTIGELRDPFSIPSALGPR